jgi:glycosyltransferase involved in cell wall biosynthesis
MVIAVNTKVIGNDFEENSDFIFETFGRIIKQHPDHTFILISEKQLKEGLITFKNVMNIAIGQQKKNPVLWYLWYNIKIAAVLKKHNAGLFISYKIASLNSRVPQCIIIPDLAFIHQPSVFKKSDLLFYKTFIPRSIKKAKLIFTVSEFCKTDIIKQYQANADKIKVVYKSVNENFKKVSDTEKEEIKTKYTNGNEYFIYSGQIGEHKNLLNLLKAFSAFKKRQRSNMQLIIAGKQGWKSEKFFESLGLFRFKDDVKILKDPTGEEITKLTAAAYALVYTSLYENFADHPLEAIKSGVPVITSSKGAMPEICGDAALYVNAENFKEIAVKMMQLFRDENFRKELIEKGKTQAQKFNWDITSHLLWSKVESCL